MRSNSPKPSQTIFQWRTGVVDSKRICLCRLHGEIEKRKVKKFLWGPQAPGGPHATKNEKWMYIQRNFCKSFATDEKIEMCDKLQGLIINP